MPSFDEEGEDVYFDTCDNIRTSIDSTSSEGSVAENQVSAFENFEQEFLTNELISVRERRSRFLRGMGLDEFLPSQVFRACETEGAGDGSAENMGLERITESSGAALDSSSSQRNGCGDSDCCIRDLDSGKRFIVQDLEQDGLFHMLKEVGSDRLISLQEFETFLGLSRSVQGLMRRVVCPGKDLGKGSNVQKQKSASWWKSFAMKRHGIGMCRNDVSVKDSKLPRTVRTNVHQHCKCCLQFSALYMGQEIKAHKGLIRVMRFSPSGCNVASGGEDSVVRIWRVGEVEASCKCSTTDDSCELIEKIKDKKFMLGGKGGINAPFVVPKKVFKIGETAFQEFRGHTSGILDISWSSADSLLSSSKDKTVRMWKIGCDECLKVFQHNNYVTCVQFNPVDNRYFISGSIDGKIRIWGVSENRVVDWADIRDIVTALCYRPDGKGFVVGSITGNCRFYECSGNAMQLDTQFCIQGKKKSAGKRITGLQFSPEHSERVMITSADSRVRIIDGAEIIHKFRGLRKTKSHLSASFSSDGRYIVSVGEDSHIYIWNCSTSQRSSSKGVKSIRPCDRFFSEGVSVAVPWPGIDETGADLCDSNLHPSPPQKNLDQANRAKDSDRCYLGTLLFGDSLSISRISATWPEDELLHSPEHSSQDGNHRPDRRSDQCRKCPSPQSDTWSRVILTASSDGIIRSFHHYGLPVRL